MRKTMVAALGAAVMLGGCATVTRGSTDQVQFDSDPTGATMRSVVDYPCGGPCPLHEYAPKRGVAYVNDDVKTPTVPGPACITPCTAQVVRNQDLIVTFTKEGYEPQTVKLGHVVAGNGVAGMAGNVILGGAAGLVVDAVSGAALDHYPNPLRVVLTPIAKPAKHAKQQ